MNLTHSYTFGLHALNLLSNYIRCIINYML